ncbi:MAG: TIGR00725 family protein [Leptospiraceae bacterium]|nr:TIGR00725 family protein [Leptospiraceae bacterium]
MRTITVIGSSQASPEQIQTAEEVGRVLADCRVRLISGGRGGVMEAVARAHSEGGGESIGILPGLDKSDANRYNTINITTGLGTGRNLINVLSGEGVIVVGGAAGTLSELAFSILYNRPILLCSFLQGASAIPPEILQQIAPQANLTFVQSESELKKAIPEWLHNL